MKALKTAGRILGRVLTVLLILALACNIYTIVARSFFGNPQPTVFGCSVAIVLSGSMEGELEVNDVVITQKQEEYAVGDVVSFINDTGTMAVTHRIIEIMPGGYLTKGDANKTPDPEPVPPERIVGRVVRVIPRVGYALEYLRSPLGLLVVTLIGAGMVYLPIILGDKNSETVRDKNDGKEETEA